MSVLTNFAALDELIQVVYQNIDRFVILSNISDSEWTLHVGQSDEGRWWRGRWTEEDVTRIIGSNVSDILLESFSETLADAIIKGELQIKDADAEDITLVLKPASKKPMHVALQEMDKQEATAYTTRVLVNIALNAQKRKCQMNPSDIPNFDLPIFTQPTTSRPKPPASTALNEDPKRATTTKESKIRKELPEKSSSKPASSSAKVPPKMKGASLANPNKKARKYQALEFDSDDD